MRRGSRRIFREAGENPCIIAHVHAAGPQSSRAIRPLEMSPPQQCKASDVSTTKLANRVNTGLQCKSIKLGKAEPNEATQELQTFEKSMAHF